MPPSGQFEHLLGQIGAHGLKRLGQRLGLVRHGLEAKACEPKATFYPVHVACGAVACRPTRAGGATCKRTNVALLEP
jgi:hypothetical protein